MTREEAITNLNMISVAFVEPITKEQRKLIDDTFDMAIKALEQEPKIGEWQQDLDGTYLCSECGSGFKEQPTLMGKPMFLWCPLCGARMVEPQESEE